MGFIRIGNELINTDLVTNVISDFDGVTVFLTGGGIRTYFGIEAGTVWSHFLAAANDLNALAEYEAAKQKKVEAPEGWEVPVF